MPMKKPASWTRRSASGGWCLDIEPDHPQRTKLLNLIEKYTANLKVVVPPEQQKPKPPLKKEPVKEKAPVNEKAPAKQKASEKSR